ncbi:lanthionine synthetase C family protein [Chitinophaga sp. Cy-1792]|uniref:lanthionine synthetase C family protein n=1 Tax=Chitinophaga sp. Cy-1792 TaxID=2608339 RepID=UPI001423ABBF|nr:lanthionine synthetase C family protein [Chitinophaga sp. Cy-1792]
MENKRMAAAILERISIALDDFSANTEYPGLLGGYSGAALFYAYYYQLTGNEAFLDKTYHIIQRSLEAISNLTLDGSHCSGLSGISWQLLHLAECGYIDQDDLDETFAEIDMALAEFMEADLNQQHIDFLHQGLGAALYFLKRLPDAHARRQLEKLVLGLHAQAHQLPQGIAWKDFFSTTATSEDNKHRNLFNLGLAHGNPAIISILARIYEKGVARDMIAPMVTSAVNWLLSTRNKDRDPGHSLFPVLIDEQDITAGDTNSRLGWCYGDLGIAVSLKDAGIRMQKPEWTAIAYEIFNNIAAHRNQENGIVYDACLCHGSAGIAVILQQAGIYNNNAALLENADHWYQHTIHQSRWTDGAAGYKYYQHPDFQTSYNMLEGISGIGLSLISFVNPDIRPGWAEAMLIM